MLRRLLEESALGAEAGVGEHRVDPPEGLERGPGQGLHLIPLADVAAHRDRLVGAAELLAQRLEPILAPGAEDEPVAGPRGAAGGSGTDPARGARDQENRMIRHPVRVLTRPLASSAAIIDTDRSPRWIPRSNGRSG